MIREEDELTVEQMDRLAEFFERKISVYKWTPKVNEVKMPRVNKDV